MQWRSLPWMDPKAKFVGELFHLIEATKIFQGETKALALN